MEEFQIETAQNVGIQQNVANLGDRMLGYLIDTLIIVFYFFIMIMIIGCRRFRSF